MPQLIEENIFKVIIPLSDQAADQAADQDADQDKRLLKVINFCKEPKSRKQIQEYLNMKHRDNFKKQVLQPLLKSGRLKLTIPDIPSSPKQKYISENKGN